MITILSVSFPPNHPINQTTSNLSPDGLRVTIRMASRL